MTEPAVHSHLPAAFLPALRLVMRRRPPPSHTTPMATVRYSPGGRGSRLKPVLPK